MNNTPLKDLGWFSFTSDLNKLRQLSIYQAIAYILNNEEDLTPLGKEYEKSISFCENLFAEDIFYSYNESTELHSTNDQIDYTNICIPEIKIQGHENFKLLQSCRIHHTERMEAPISIIYYLFT